MDNASPRRPGHVARRSLVRGTAWATPVVLLGAAAPALAASPAPGLQGGIWWTRRCNGTSTTLGVDGTAGAIYPAGPYGLYVLNTTSSMSITNACISWSYSPSFGGGIQWSRDGGSESWSMPTYDSVTGKWTSCYSGSWTYHPASGSLGSYTIADGVPAFVGEVSTPLGGCKVSRRLTVTRSVTLNGTVISFDGTTTI